MESERILHPMFVHLPLAMAVLIPLVWAGVFYSTRRAILPPQIWNLFWFFCLALNGGNALAFWSGTRDSQFSGVDESILQLHQRTATFFVIGSAILFVLASWLSFRPPRRLRHLTVLQVSLLIFALFNLGLAIRAGYLGGYMVFGTDTPLNR
ncbi:MAG: hypothetical protein NDI61_06605 [Bdellovibrionaceae bacterium]|nr:hypothetical protein [Pseudobdellovibrionaceae bacterium]